MHIFYLGFICIMNEKANPATKRVRKAMGLSGAIATAPKEIAELPCVGRSIFFIKGELMFKKHFLMGFVGIFVFLTLFNSSVAIMRGMDIANLTQSSSSVVMGKVINSQSMWKENIIVTLATIEISRVI